MNTKDNFSRITIDMPKIDHKKLKAISALLGKRMGGLKETLKAFENVEKGKDLTKAKDIKDLFKKLGI